MRISRVCSGFLVALLCTACSEADRTGRSPEADVAAVNDLREREVAAAEAGDVEALLSLRADDFIAMPPDQPPVRGREAVRVFLTAMFAQVQLEEEVASEGVVVAADWAYDRGMFSGTVRPKEGGEAMSVAGKYLWIARRQSDGSWRYTVQMWSNNQPPTM
jgi:ketosteroid isomerase-like protein